MVLSANAIYRSTSALIYKKGTGLDGVESLSSDPRLYRAHRHAAGLGRRYAHSEIRTDRVHGYPLIVDRRREHDE
ncbi:hypothetical protein [Bradyrhizobium sp. RDI18]|uniref:hypothetical protein n=1 Tax=Bradyrhizobium sp. RDI18 TaxID=3367400 RepID=UPI00371905C3